MDFRSKRSIIIYFIIALLLIVGGIKLKYVLDNIDNIGNNIERITYNRRTYIRSRDQTMNSDLKKEFAASKPTGKYSKRMEVYDIDNNPNASTVIFLKTSDGKFVIYSLSGGP